MKIGHRRLWKWSSIEGIQALSVPGLSSCQPAGSKRVKEYRSFEATLFLGKFIWFPCTFPKLCLQTKLLQNSDYALLLPVIFISDKSLTFRDIFETLGEAGCFRDRKFGRNADWNSWRIAVCSTEIKNALKNWITATKKMVGTTFSFLFVYLSG